MFETKREVNGNNSLFIPQKNESVDFLSDILCKGESICCNMCPFCLRNAQLSLRTAFLNSLDFADDGRVGFLDCAGHSQGVHSRRVQLQLFILYARCDEHHASEIPQ